MLHIHIGKKSDSTYFHGKQLPLYSKKEAIKPERSSRRS